MFHSYLVADGHGLRRNPLKAIVAPRPIGWISSRSASGQFNLAPYSFFNMIGDAPPMIAFSSNGRKDSLRNCEETGEFVWNLATRSLAEQMNVSSSPVPPTVNEFELANLTPVPGMLVAAPRVGESPAALECKVCQIIPLKSIDGSATDQWLTIGQIVAVHINRDYISDGLFQTGTAQPIMRAGYAADYAVIDEKSMFQMGRPSIDIE